MGRRAEKNRHSLESGLYNQYFAPTLGYLQRLTNDPMLAEDLAQDTLLVLLQKLRSTQLTDHDQLDAYVRAIARNLWIARLRRCDSSRLVFTDQTNFEAASPNRDYLADEGKFRAALAHAVAHQPVARDRDILTRHYIREQPKSEICRALNLTPNHYDRVLSRARRRLRSVAEQWLEGHGLSPQQFVDLLCAGVSQAKIPSPSWPSNNVS